MRLRDRYSEFCGMAGKRTNDRSTIKAMRQVWLEGVSAGISCVAVILVNEELTPEQKIERFSLLKRDLDDLIRKAQEGEL